MMRVGQIDPRKGLDAWPDQSKHPGVDPEPIPFGYELVGCVNGAEAALRIEGLVARHDVRFETNLAFPGEPLLWDEKILALAAIDPVVLLSLDLDTVRRDAAPEVFRVESARGRSNSHGREREEA